MRKTRTKPKPSSELAAKMSPPSLSATASAKLSRSTSTLSVYPRPTLTSEGGHLSIAYSQIATIRIQGDRLTKVAAPKQKSYKLDKGLWAYVVTDPISAPDAFCARRAPIDSKCEATAGNCKFPPPPSGGASPCHCPRYRCLRTLLSVR